MAVKNRWGQSFTKGARVRWRGGSYTGEGHYLRLDAADDFSRAYGRQALVWASPGTMPRGTVGRGHPDVVTVGLDDLEVVEGRRATGRRTCSCQGKR